MKTREKISEIIVHYNKYYVEIYSNNHVSFNILGYEWHIFMFVLVALTRVFKTVISVCNLVVENRLLLITIHQNNAFKHFGFRSSLASYKKQAIKFYCFLLTLIYTRIVLFSEVSINSTHNNFLLFSVV